MVMLELPDDLVEAFSDGGHPTVDQVRRLAEIEAAALGMSLDDALVAAREGRLPNNPIGIDLRYMADELTAA